ncbi:MAG TPA: sensor histidine kinase, partial [Catalimonadaceae bacterium]|nr:sensor histidine kinase [Catalimonadaceae bacterium]
LARDLHDGLGGMLSGLKFSLNNMKGNMILDEENASAFSISIGQLDNVISEMRRVAHSMMPEALVRFGLKEASQDLCDQMMKTSGLQIHFQAIGMDGELKKSDSVALYRIEQELLNNILKHAEATEITVQLVRDESQISLTVEDNGKGFDPSLIPQGAGLTSIRTRVEALGGRLDIQSKPGEGSSFLIELEVA